MLKVQGCGAIVFDAASFGDEGPELVGRIKAESPSTRIVVIASRESTLEPAYRAHRIFYYAMEPFADNEILDILDTVFRSQPAAAEPVKHLNTASGSVSRIAITNRNGTKVRVVAAPGVLRQNEGLCWHVKQKLLSRLFPIETTPGEASINPLSVLAAAGACDRLMVIVTKDTKRLPGSLVHDTKAEFMAVSGEGADKVSVWAIQPSGPEGDPPTFDARTTAALAEHIVREMASW
jgi:hypothetical protein